MNDNKLVEDNIQLIRKVAHSMKPSSYTEYEDYVQAGALALLQALPKFEPERGYAFSTFAWYVVRNAICNHKRYESKHQRYRAGDLYDTPAYYSTESISEYLPELTPEEADIIKLKLEGYSNKEVASKLGIKSVNKRVRKTLDKVKDKCI